MTGIALALAARVADAGLESALIASARIELAGFYLARLPAELRGGVELWLCCCGVRR